MEGTLFAMIVGLGALLILLGGIWYILQVIAYWRLFTKAGEQGWKSIIPIYNIYIQYKLTWDTRVFWWLLGCLAAMAICSVFEGPLLALEGVLSLAVTVLNFFASYQLSKAFGHGLGFAIGLVFLNPIFMLILGFGDSQYIGPQN